MAFRAAFISGASSGLGHAIARALAAQGTRVVLAARRREQLEQLRDDIVGAGGGADVCVLDVANAAAVTAAVQQWDERSGGFDLVIANAGVGGTGPAHELRWSTVEKMLRVNVDGALATLVAAIPGMTSRGVGTLAAVTSLAGLRGLPASATYSASKAAVSTFLESIRADLHGHGLRVCDIQPGFVDTPLTQQNRFHMPFMISADDAAAAVVQGLSRGSAIISFPWQLSMAMRIAENMPNPLWNALARRSSFSG